MLVCSFASDLSLAIDLSEACSVYYNELQCLCLIIEGAWTVVKFSRMRSSLCSISLGQCVSVSHICLLSYDM